jgi:alpha-glucosidase (family GH31 glycosyl hydrolase)
MAIRNTPVLFGNARFTFHAPGAVRMQYQARRIFPRMPSVLTAFKLPKPLKADVRVRGKTLTIHTDKMTLTFTNDGKPFHAGNLSIEHPRGVSGAGAWRPGDPDEPLVEHVRSLDVWPAYENFTREAHPGLFDRRGRRCINDDAAVYHTPDGQWGEGVFIHDRALDWWFFGYGRDYAGALRDFIGVFGPVPLVPRWVFGFWYSRWFDYTQKEVIDIVKKYRKAGLPVDVMVVDTAWRENNWFGYNWSRKRFPDPRKFIAALHRMGVKVPLNDHPGYMRPTELPPDDRALPAIKKRLGEPPARGLWACNWASRRSVEVWKEEALAAPFREGMDFWWIDGWSQDYLMFGQNLKAQFWVNRHYYEVCERETAKRGLVLSRWGGWGSHRYPVQFSGDTESNWQTLQHQIQFTAAAGDAGACYWSHDIGGFHSRTIPDDLYIRWVQFGAFSPIFRTHSAFGTREPFAYSKQAQRAFKQAVRHRYAMTPYWYHLAREAHDQALPLCRPMYLHYPEHHGAYAVKTQYLIGRDMLVVPGANGGQKCTQTWWVPPGTWVRPETGEVFEHTETRPMEIPLDTTPVLYRLGAVIPHQAPSDYTDQKPLDPLYLDIYPSAEGGEIDLYEDDGETRAFERGRCARTKAACRRTDAKIEIEIGAPRGHYPGHRANRKFVLNVWLASGEDVRGVEMNGEALRKSAWKISRTYAGDAAKGLARFARVTIAPDGKPARVTLSLE